LAAIKGATAIDAIVMASAAQRGDVVYTADTSDLAKLAVYFRAVRVLGIG
jgi:DNA-directed RNA polymerase subunit H (RpoH/RPB5)